MRVRPALVERGRRRIGSIMTWAEDRATVGTDPSADPGAKTDGRAEDRLACSARSSHRLRDWHQCDKSLAATAASHRVSRWQKYPEKCGNIFRNAQARAHCGGGTHAN